MIETCNLTKIYDHSGLFSFRRQSKQTLAVDKLNLQIKDGQIFGLLGVNGAGKTTTTKMLCTLLEPTSGTAVVGGYDIVRDADKVRRIVNMIAGGERMLYWRLTGRENLSYFADLYDVEESIKKGRIAELLELVGLTEYADTPVEQYSKGMKQRLQIARGLINDPQYLFMDEPTIGLDAPIAREIRRVIKENLSKTILFTTHYLEEAEELCDEVAIIHKGEIAELGTPDQLKRKYKKGCSLIVVVDGKDDATDQVLQTIRQAHDATISTTVVEDGCQIRVDTVQDITSELVDALTKAHRQILELRSVELSLEDVLITVSGEEVEL